MSVLTKILFLPFHFPLFRGMVSYAVIWPTCSLVQEYLEHGTTLEKANWARAARFGIFGTFFMAPVFYGWMKYSSRFFIRKDLMTAISRAAVEQVTYSPLAMAYFFFGMSLLEGKPFKLCLNEVREKFWPTYRIGVVFWPTAQTLNFYFVSEKNRIVFVSIASFLWTVYLAHMKGKQQKSDNMILDPQSLVALKSADEKTKPNNSPMLVLEFNSDLNDQQAIIEVDRPVENVNDKNQVLAVERDSEDTEVPDVPVESVNVKNQVLVVERDSEDAEVADVLIVPKVLDLYTEPNLDNKPENNSVKSVSDLTAAKINVEDVIQEEIVQ